MITLTSEIVGKEVKYGRVKDRFELEGFVLAGGWEYDHAYFDGIISQDDNITIYVRIPVYVTAGKLDHADAVLKFGRPFMVKHVVHTGFDTEDSDYSLLDVTGLNQFQPPRDPDDYIRDAERWKKVGELAVARVNTSLHS